MDSPAILIANIGDEVLEVGEGFLVSSWWSSDAARFMFNVKVFGAVLVERLVEGETSEMVRLDVF